MACPLCGRHFHQQLVESHAASCLGPGTGRSSPPAGRSSSADAEPRQVAAVAAVAPVSVCVERAGGTGTAGPAGSTSSANPLGPLRRTKAHDRPGKQSRRSLSLPEFDFLVVLDFEWTCDDKGAVPGGAEIIEFPSVLLRLKPGGVTETVAELQLYVRPERSPTLTRFCKDLTGITQDQVDGGLLLIAALGQYREWLVEQGLLPSLASSPAPSPEAGGESNRAGPRWPRFALLTWSDADLGGQLYGECERKGLHHARSWWFQSWINLKPLYGQHYRREPRGGLQACVEATGQTFDGRAHSGLVDAQNTAKIVINMRREGFRFVRTTRGCDANGVPYGRDASSSNADDDGGQQSSAVRLPQQKRRRKPPTTASTSAALVSTGGAPSVSE